MAKSYSITSYAVLLPDTCEKVRRHCAAVAARARWIEIDCDAATYDGGTSGLDPAIHLLDAAPEDVARFILILDGPASENYIICSGRAVSGLETCAVPNWISA
ncbi:MAG: hypothetical protein LC777_14850 [Actinobacteria bacterium]|nr:hypothetical protein [Actinomycetota bacterium]